MEISLIVVLFFVLEKIRSIGIFRVKNMLFFRR